MSSRERELFRKPRKETTMAEEGAVIACHTEEHWRQQLQLANESKKLVIYPSPHLLCFRSCYPSLFFMRIRCFLLKVLIYVFGILSFWMRFSDLFHRNYGSFSPQFFICFIIIIIIIIVLIFRVLGYIPSWFVVRCDVNGK